jgi:RHS repeat-associated protein
LRARIEQSCSHSYTFTAFGEELNPKTESYFNPWRYASKRFDPELNLIYFGKRYYDPASSRWLTTDPAGFIDSINLYQYVLNNPFHYVDPDGQFIFAVPLLALTWKLVAVAAVTAFVSYEIDQHLISSGNSTNEAINGAAQSLFGMVPNALIQAKKNTNVYVPDRPLPNTPDGVHIPDVDAPHTQLGTKGGRKGEYPQAREFDEHGNPVRDIDFTDHGRPQNHPNPHQHEHKPNPTGGTPIRDPKGQPVTGWNYL